MTGRRFFVIVWFRRVYHVYNYNNVVTVNGVTSKFELESDVFNGLLLVRARPYQTFVDVGAGKYRYFNFQPF